MKDALNSGISMIFQEYNSVGPADDAENIYRGASRSPNSRRSTIKDESGAKEIIGKMGVDIDPKERSRASP
jgi:ABC-type uncharacterized transport system ATPase subunit